MGDLFHKDVHRQDIVHIWNVMARNPQHIFQILTKRADRMLYFLDWIKGQVPFDVWPLPNVHLGTTAENQETANERIPLLLQCPAAKRFVSCEPLLSDILFRSIDCRTCNGRGWFDNGPLDQFKCEYCDEHGRISQLNQLDQVIVGAETGPGKRHMSRHWARSIRDQCITADVPFFFKKDALGDHKLDGKIWEELPEYSQVRTLVAGITEGRGVE
jgi:protein gp37